MHNKGGAPVAFVEYADVRFAAQALITLQGTYLLSSDRGGVRIEYARSRMAEIGTSPTTMSTTLSAADKIKHDIETKMSPAAAAVSANPLAASTALSQAVQGPLHALGLYGHHIWLGILFGHAIFNYHDK